jgi:predicted component of type VI protein secretion system
LPALLHRVDRDTLPELLAGFAPVLEIGGTTLPFPEARAFRPEALAAALPATRALRALRERLKGAPAPTTAELAAALDRLEAPGADVEALRRALAPPPRPANAPTPPPAPAAAPFAPATPTAGGDALDNLLGMVDVGGGAGAAEEIPPAAATRALDRLVREFAGISRAPGALPTATLRALEHTLDEAMAGALREALHAPAFQALEEAWAGLRFLVRRIDFRSGIRLHVVPVAAAGAPRAMEAVVAPFAAEQRLEARTVCVLAAFRYGAGDLAALEALAAAAESARVPVVADAAPSLAGHASLAEADRVGEPFEPVDPGARARWAALRAGDPSRWLALATTRALLRLPYGAEQDRVRDFAFEENPVGGEADYLWGAATWALGAMIAGSVERTGWATEIAGPGESATVEDLPVRPLTLRTGEVVQCPLETLLGEPRVLALSEAGFVPLACRRNRDAAFTVSTATVHRPVGEEGRAAGVMEARRASLAYALFLAQVMALSEHLLGWVDRGKPRADVATTLAKSLEFLTSTREGPLLSATVEDGGAGPLAIRLRPLAGPLRGLPETVFEIPLA